MPLNAPIEKLIEIPTPISAAMLVNSWAQVLVPPMVPKDLKLDARYREQVVGSTVVGVALPLVESYVNGSRIFTQYPEEPMEQFTPHVVKFNWWDRLKCMVVTPKGLVMSPDGFNELTVTAQIFGLNPSQFVLCCVQDFKKFRSVTYNNGTIWVRSPSGNLNELEIPLLSH